AGGAILWLALLRLVGLARCRDDADRVGRELLQQFDLAIGEFARFGVEDAQGAERKPGLREQRRARIEAAVPSRDRRIVGEARIALGVRHDQRLTARDDMVAYGL